MRTLTKSFLLLIFALTSLTGCMQHNGDIGDFFGTWKVTSITVDGVEDATYQDNIFFQFQTDVVRLVQSRPHNDYTEFFGSWSEDSGELILDFHYKVDPISPVYNIPAVTRLQAGVNHLTISDDSSRKMTWTFSNDGSTVVYKLSKQ